MIIGILVAVVILAIIVLAVKSRKGRPVNSSSLDSVLKNSYPNLSYKEVLKLGYDNAAHLLRSLPCVFDEVELLAFLCQTGRMAVMAVRGDIRAWGKESSEFINSMISGDQRQQYIKRYCFYLGISGGEKVEAVWPLSDIPQSVLSVPMFRSAVAFGDCITNPDMIEDYYSGGLYLWGATEKVEFARRYIDDFFRFVHTFCVMVAGREFDPPILSPDEMEQ